MKYEQHVLEPFGLELRFPPGSTWSGLDHGNLEGLVQQHRLVLLRGLESMNKFELVAAARSLGPIQSWEFGAINDLKVDARARNYLYTDREVPLHWDGAFARTEPLYLVFQCLQAASPGGGETIFVDTTRVLESASPEQRERWQGQRFSYSTEKLAHYGGSFTAALVQRHPVSQEAIMRYAEPVNDLNPVQVHAESRDGRAVMDELSDVLRRPEAVYHHKWQQGDLVIADNQALLHGRNAFTAPTERHLQRVNVLRPEKSRWRGLRAFIRIRRPEFMIAEIPILLIPLFLLSIPLAQFMSSVFALGCLLFFLLFHFGDMINCLADRDLDAVYKTRLSEAVYALGTKNVIVQIVLTGLAALGITAFLSWQLERPVLLTVVGLGMALAAGYSLPPFRLKGRGVLQIICAWLMIFVGPMLLIALLFVPQPPVALFGSIAAYGLLQCGIILVNTAEDYAEDLESGVQTTAVVLGPTATIGLAAWCIALGGGLLPLSLSLLYTTITFPAWVVSSLALFGFAWIWVLLAVARLWRRLAGCSTRECMLHIKAAGRKVPLWMTVIAWSVLHLALSLYFHVL